MPICGDGIVVIEEECDDGVAGDDKGCNNECTFPLPGWEC